MFNEVLVLCEAVKQNTSSHGCDRIRQEIQILKDELDSFQNLLENTEQSLVSSIQGLDQLADDREKFVQWLDETETTIKEKASHFQLEKPEQQVTEFEVILLIMLQCVYVLCVCVCVCVARERER